MDRPESANTLANATAEQVQLAVCPQHVAQWDWLLAAEAGPAVEQFINNSKTHQAGYSGLHTR